MIRGTGTSLASASACRPDGVGGAGTSSSTQETRKKTIPFKEAARVTALKERAAQNKQNRQQHKRSSSKASPLPNKRKRAGKKPRRMSKSKVKAALAFHGITITSEQEEELKKTTGTSNDDDEDMERRGRQLGIPLSLSSLRWNRLTRPKTAGASISGSFLQRPSGE